MPTYPAAAAQAKAGNLPIPPEGGVPFDQTNSRPAPCLYPFAGRLFPGGSEEEKPPAGAANAAKAIKEHSGDADTVEILPWSPPPQPPEYYALVQLTDDARAVSKRFHHLVKGKMPLLSSPYYFDSQPEMAISANYEILGNNTVVYGEINWGHTQLLEKAFLPIEVSRIDLRLEGGEFCLRHPVQGAYPCVSKAKGPLAQSGVL